MAQISVVVNEKGIDTTERKLKKLGDTGKKTESNIIRAENRFKSFGKNASAAVAAVDGPLGGVSSRISSVTTLLTSGTAAATAFGVAVSAVGASLIAGTLALDEYEVGLRRTEAILKTTGNAAGFTAEQLRDQADALGRATLTSTQEVQKAQAQLLTFNRVAGDTFTRAIELSQDLAEVGFGSITSASVQLGKALQDPVKGISSLTRVGVSFTAEQQNLISSLVESNQLLEAQTIILDALEQQVGGAGAAVAVNTLAGSWDTFTDALEKFNVQAAQASGISSALNAVLAQTASDLDAVTAALDANSRANFDELIRQRIQLQEDLRELESNAGIFGASEGAVNRVKSQLAEVEKELVRIQDFEKARQERITAAQEASNETQRQLDEQAAAEREVLRLEEEEKINEQRNRLAIQEEIEIQRTFDALKAANDEKLEEWQRYYTGVSDFAAESAKSRRQIEEANNRALLEGLDGVTANLQTALGEQNALYKAAAITQTTIATYQSATESYKALAGIPIVGPGLGFAAAGVAVAAGLANVAKITSARAQGGQVNRGDNVLVGERGPEVVNFGSGGRVIPNNQLSGNSQFMAGNVYITNNTPANVTAEQDDAGNTYVRIDELDSLIGASLSNPNSEGFNGLASAARLERNG